MAKVAVPLSELNESQLGSLRPYHIGLDEHGEPVSKFKILPGVVRTIRFDAKEGKFKIAMGGDNLKDIGRTLTFRPLAWRLFWDPNLFNMGPKDWAEIFFIDENNVVCAVLFHGYSVTNLNSLIGPLHFDDLMLSDVILTVTAEKKARKEDNGTFYIANFTFKGADAMPADVEAFLADVPIYRDETLTEQSDVKAHHGMKYIIRPHGGFNANPADDKALPWEEPKQLAEGK